MGITSLVNKVATKNLARVESGLNSKNRTRVVGVNNVLNTIKTVQQRGSLTPIKGILQQTTSGRPGAVPLPILTKPATLILKNSPIITSKTVSLAKAVNYETRKAVIAASVNLKPRVILGNKGPTQLDMYTNPRPIPGVPGNQRGFSGAVKGTGFWGLSFRDYLVNVPAARKNLIGTKQLQDVEELTKTRGMNRAEMLSVSKTAIVLDGGQILTTVIDKRNGDATLAPLPETHTPAGSPTENLNGMLFLVGAVFLGYLALR